MTSHINTPRGEKWLQTVLLVHEKAEKKSIEWRDISRDDFIAEIDGLVLRVEHLEGPFNGGIWWWAVFDDNHENVSDNFGEGSSDVVPKNSKRAKWLCEVVAEAYLSR